MPVSRRILAIRKASSCLRFGARTRSSLSFGADTAEANGGEWLCLHFSNHRLSRIGPRRPNLSASVRGSRTDYCQFACNAEDSLLLSVLAYETFNGAMNLHFEECSRKKLLVEEGLLPEIMQDGRLREYDHVPANLIRGA